MSITTAEQWKAKGNEHFALQRYNDAVGCFTKAIGAFSSNPSEGNLAVYYSNRSVAYMQLKQLNNALEDANKAVQADPKWPKGYLRQSAAFSALTRFREALQSLLTALRLSGPSADLSLLSDVDKAWSSYIGTPFTA